MTALEIYTYALPFLIVGAVAVIYWWTGREAHDQSAKHRRL